MAGLICQNKFMGPELAITIINQTSAWSGWLPAITGIGGTALGGWIAARVSKSAAQRQWTSDAYEHTRKYFGELLIATDSLFIHVNNIVRKYEKARSDGVKSAVESGIAKKGGRVDFRIEQTPEELQRSSETLAEFRKVLSRAGLYGQDIHDKIFAVDKSRAKLVEDLNDGLIDAAIRELEIFKIEVQILRRGTQRDVALHGLPVLNNIAPWRGRRQQRGQAIATITEIDQLDTNDQQKIKVLRVKPKDDLPIIVKSVGIKPMQ